MCGASSFLNAPCGKRARAANRRGSEPLLGTGGRAESWPRTSPGDQSS